MLKKKKAREGWAFFLGQRDPCMSEPEEDMHFKPLVAAILSQRAVSGLSRPQREALARQLTSFRG